MADVRSQQVWMLVDGTLQRRGRPTSPPPPPPPAGGFGTAPFGTSPFGQ